MFRAFCASIETALRYCEEREQRGTPGRNTVTGTLFLTQIRYLSPYFCLRLKTLAVFFGVSLAAVFAAETPAMAQSETASIREISREIDRLKRQLRAVQRQVFAGAPGSEFENLEPLEPAGAPTSAPNPALIANMEVRIGQLETELRTLTGQLEMISHTQNQLMRRIDLLQSDLEFRLDALEQAPRVTASQAAVTDDAVAGAAPDAGQATAADAAAGGALPEGSAQERYDFAFGLLKRGDFAGAEAAFMAFIEEHRDDALAGNAQYWLGETYYVQRDYPRAAAAFLKGFQDHKNGAKGPDSLLKLGISLTNLDQKEEACAAFDEFERQYTAPPQPMRDRLASEKSRAGCS